MLFPSLIPRLFGGVKQCMQNCFPGSGNRFARGAFFERLNFTVGDFPSHGSAKVVSVVDDDDGCRCAETT